jgi:hypothetical protein
MVKAGLSKQGVHLTRVENAIMSGTPDVNACYQGVEWWMELKSGTLTLRPAQVTWINTRITHGGKVFIVHRYSETLIRIYHGSDVINIYKKLPFTIFPIEFVKPFKWEKMLQTFILSGFNGGNELCLLK